MEGTITFLAILAVIAVISNFVIAYFDYRVKDEIGYLLSELLKGGRPQNIILTQGQADKIAKIVRDMISKKEGNS